MDYNIHNSSSTVTATSTGKPTTYIDDLIKSVRNTKTEEDARWNAKRIMEEELNRRMEKMKDILLSLIMVLVLVIVFQNFII